MSLKEYNKKRNFKKTDEPKGEVIGKTGNRLSFVIQKHQANTLHYDLRLEWDGVLKSWAIPKGPPLNTGEKRLAVMVEDHPLDYGKFEGIIPEGEYGAGTVAIWDKGCYHSIQKKDEGTVPIDDAIKNGHIEIEILGKKIRGKYALIRTEFREKNDWLLVKMRDR